MPKKLATIVGSAKIIVMVARNFKTMFKLLDIIEAKASIVPLKIFA